MEFCYWAPDTSWGLPTIDISSLEILAYIKFSRANVKLTPTFKAWLNKREKQLPCLHTPDDSVLLSKDEIFQHLRLKYYSLDNWLNDEDKLKVLPLKTLIEEKVVTAINALLWLDSRNFTELTRSVYAKRCRYPLNFTYPQNARKALENNIMVKNNFLEEERNSITEKLHSSAVEVIDLIDEYIGSNKDYLFGKRPCSLDAQLFSCLAILLKAPLLSCKLQNHLKTKISTCQYIERILADHFIEAKVPGDEAAAIAHDDEDKYDWILPVSVAIIAMTSYAVNIGLFQATK